MNLAAHPFRLSFGLFQFEAFRLSTLLNPPVGRLLGFPRSPKYYHPLGPIPCDPDARLSPLGQSQRLIGLKTAITAW